jgi:hypothetical protein
MELELMNIFHLTIDDMLIVMRVNCNKKQLADELKAYASVESSFRHVKFKTHMTKKGYKFYYEGR